MKIVVTEFMDEAALAGVEADVVYDPALVDARAKMLSELGDADAIIVRNRTRVDAELLAAAPRLRAVGRLGVGLDNIDLAACEARGVSVHPATGANADAVAEYVIASAMVLVRQAFFSQGPMLAGEWPRGRLGQGGEIGGRTMGLVGHGGIGRAVARRATALGMDVIGHDPQIAADDPSWGATKPLPFEDVLARADIVSLHVPLTSGTHHLVDADAIARMKPSAILVNTARGGVVDEAALSAALKEGRLDGAALDVFETEPLTAGAARIFEGVPNLILTPHIAGVTAEANVRVSAITIANVLEALR